MPEGFRYMSVKFQIEHSRLKDFGRVAGLIENIEEWNSVEASEPTSFYF
jgi:hypothetical protein